MKTLFVLALMMIGFFAKSAQAQTKHCHTIEDCQTLKLEVETDLAELLTPPELTGILKIGVSFDEAIKICKDQGMRLPTAREFALVAQSLGAKGISGTKLDGYLRVIGQDSVGNPDSFYYSDDGYKRPVGELGKRWWLWSSSVRPDYPDKGYQFRGEDGYIAYVHASHEDSHNLESAVRCIQPH